MHCSVTAAITENQGRNHYEGLWHLTFHNPIEQHVIKIII